MHFRRKHKINIYRLMLTFAFMNRHYTDLDLIF